LDCAVREVDDDPQGEEYFSGFGGFASLMVSLVVPLQASVSVVSAAWAVGNPTSITARAITRELVRSIERAQPVHAAMSVPHSATLG
jgi:hypothetical protein